MLGDVHDLRSAARTGDLAGARRAWLAADSRYESIGAAYGAFGELDAAINGRADGLEGGVRSRDFRGLHRIEYALWRQGSVRAAMPWADRLARDVVRLRLAVGTIAIDPFEYGLRAHEVLEDSLHLQLSGQASPWSGAALVALDANVRGTDVVLGSLRPLVARRNPAVLKRAERSLALLRDALGDVRAQDGSFPRWDDVEQRDRELIGGRTAAAAEQLAFVPEIVDSRPARPVQRAFGTGGAQ
jgi:iron uptake system EfeUOB component EfeO/EfeM